MKTSTPLISLYFYIGIIISLASVNFSFAQVFTGTVLELTHNTLGGNSDYTAIYRADTQADHTHLRIMMGDEVTSEFDIGYTNWQDGLWYSNFKLDGYGNTFINGNVGIGTSAPAAKLDVAALFRMETLELYWHDYRKEIQPVMVHFWV